ncbi:MAG: hypothetical protein U0T77_07210 [Chitinophagales bacterium]
MHKSGYKFRYIPQYSDMLYLIVFLLGLGVLALKEYLFYLIFYLAVIFLGFFLFIQYKTKILFFEDYIELHNGVFFNKKIIRKKYEDILLIQYCFAEIRGSNLFRISLKYKNNKITKIQYSFIGRPSKQEISFFKSKNINILVVPDSAKNKLQI